MREQGLRAQAIFQTGILKSVGGKQACSVRHGRGPWGRWEQSYTRANMLLLTHWASARARPLPAFCICDPFPTGAPMHSVTFCPMQATVQEREDPLHTVGALVQSAGWFCHWPRWCQMG